MEGRYQPGSHSVQIDAHLEIDAQGLVRCPEVGLENLDFAVLDISARIGNSPRYFNFPDGACFETDDNDGVDRWLREYGHADRSGLIVHRLETTAKFVAATALVIVLLGYAFFTWGLPWLSERVAYALPPQVSAAIGRGTLDFLDQHLLEPSQLPTGRQEQLTARFAELRPEQSGFEFKLELRHGGDIGANAFALPDGTVVLTDELIELASDDMQVAAVMLHEIGHVERRHGLRATVHGAGLATALVLVAGDVSSVNSLLVTLPALLVETSYSREMETEADIFAVEAMIQLGLEPNQLLAFLTRLEESIAGESSADHSGAGLLGYLSTHPLGEARLEPLRDAMIRAAGSTLH